MTGSCDNLKNPAFSPEVKHLLGYSDIAKHSDVVRKNTSSETVDAEGKSR